VVEMAESITLCDELQGIHLPDEPDSILWHLIVGLLTRFNFKDHIAVLTPRHSGVPMRKGSTSSSLGC
jgi:hypothetical protein